MYFKGIISNPTSPHTFIPAKAGMKVWARMTMGRVTCRIRYDPYFNIRSHAPIS